MDDKMDHAVKIKTKFQLSDSRTAPALAVYFTKAGKYGNVQLLEAQLREERALNTNFYLTQFGQIIQDEGEAHNVLAKISDSYVGPENLASLYRMAQEADVDTYEIRKKIVEIASDKGVFDKIYNNNAK